MHTLGSQIHYPIRVNFIPISLWRPVFLRFMNIGKMNILLAQLQIAF